MKFIVSRCGSDAIDPQTFGVEAGQDNDSGTTEDRMQRRCYNETSSLTIANCLVLLLVLCLALILALNLLFS